VAVGGLSAIGPLEALMADILRLSSDSRKLLTKVGRRKTTLEYQDQQTIYSQGDVADAIFHIQSGNVKLTVESRRGKKAVIAFLGRGDIFGTGCLAKRASLRMSGATAVHPSTISRVKRETMVRAINKDPAFSRFFISYLLSRIAQIREDLLAHIFDSSEQRLARVLLSLERFGNHDKAQTVIPKISQQTLAEIVGTTRSRISHFMNKFRKLGFVDYDDSSNELKVHSRLLSVILHD
jgi:CRP/FNR family transcriptional regulator, cyclic AMP receptor protein